MIGCQASILNTFVNRFSLILSGAIADKYYCYGCEKKIKSAVIKISYMAARSIST